jgi:hypothetical protein
VLYLKDAVKKKSLGQELETAPIKLLGIIHELGINKKCHGSIIDDDLAIIPEDYFKSKRSSSRSVCCIVSFIAKGHHHLIIFKGTADFMSQDLLDAIKDRSPKLQSPMDDFFSFYFVIQWAIIFNNREFTGDLKRPVPLRLSSLRSNLSEGGEKRSHVVMVIQQSIIKEEDYGLFFTQCAPFMAEWNISLIATNKLWANKLELYTKETLENPSQTYLALFKELTTQLVIDTLKIAHKHLASFSEVEAV